MMSVEITTYAHLAPADLDVLARENIRVVAEGPLKKGLPHTLDVPALVTLALPEGSTIHEDKWLPDSLGEFGPLSPRLLATLPSGRRLITIYGTNGGEDIAVIGPGRSTD